MCLGVLPAMWVHLCAVLEKARKGCTLPFYCCFRRLSVIHHVSAGKATQSSTCSNHCALSPALAVGFLFCVRLCVTVLELTL